jgi:hypothetical protein
MLTTRGSYGGPVASAFSWTAWHPAKGVVVTRDTRPLMGCWVAREPGCFAIDGVFPPARLPAVSTIFLKIPDFSQFR